MEKKLFDAAARPRKPAYASGLAIINDWGSAKGTRKKAAAGANGPDHVMEWAKLQGLRPGPDPQ